MIFLLAVCGFCPFFAVLPFSMSFNYASRLHDVAHRCWRTLEAWVLSTFGSPYWMFGQPVETLPSIPAMWHRETLVH
jgi:hypothetical protein